MSARSNRAPQPVYRRKPDPLSLAPRAKSMSLSRSQSSTWLHGVNSKEAFCPCTRISGLSAASLPKATLAWGRLGIMSSRESRAASACAAVLSSSVIRSPRARTSAFLDSASSRRFWPISPPISFEVLLRRALSCSASASAARRDSSRAKTSETLASSPAFRVANRSRTNSVRSRNNFMSSMVRGYGSRGGKENGISRPILTGQKQGVFAMRSRKELFLNGPLNGEAQERRQLLLNCSKSLSAWDECTRNCSPRNPALGVRWRQ